MLTTLILLTLGGCEENFTQIDSKDLQDKWESSIKHTAVSWWYLGEKGNYHYVVEKWPMKKYGYKIDKTQLDVISDQPKELTFKESGWINLKKGDLVFKGRKKGLQF